MEKWMRELQIIWEYRDLLELKASGWEAIAFTLLHDWRNDWIKWITCHLFDIVNAVQKIIPADDDQEAIVRRYLILTTLKVSEEDRIQAARMSLLSLARNNLSEWMRWRAAEGIALLGETQTARDVLNYLIDNYFDERVRWQAVEALAELGDIARSNLAELTHDSLDEQTRLNSAKGLAGLGETQIAQKVLSVCHL